MQVKGIKPSVIGTIVSFEVDSQSDAIRLARYFTRNERILVDILPFYAKRSTGEHSQNNHIWGHASQIADHVGHTKTEVVEIALKYAFNRGQVRAREHPVSGEIVLGEDGNQLPVSSSQLNSKEAAALIDCLHEIAGFNEVKLIERWG